MEQRIALLQKENVGQSLNQVLTTFESYNEELQSNKTAIANLKAEVEQLRRDKFILELNNLQLTVKDFLDISDEWTDLQRSGNFRSAAP